MTRKERLKTNRKERKKRAIELRESRERMIVEVTILNQMLREEVERLNGVIAEMAQEKPTIAPAPAAERISPPRQNGGILSMGIKVHSGIRA